MPSTIQRSVLPADRFWQVRDDAVPFTFAINRGRFVLITPIVVATGPTLINIVPSRACVGGEVFTLTVIGSGFTAAGVVKVNGSARTTVYVDASQLTATIPASDLLMAAVLTITVTDASGTSNANALFVVDCPKPYGGKGPLLRPDFDHLVEYRLDATGSTIRTIRSVQKSQEETTRQQVEV